MFTNKFLILFSLIISLSIEGPCSITIRADKYTKCRDKKPSDTRNHVCCYLEANNEAVQRCVEVRKTELESSDKFDKLEEQIKAGTYDFWLMENYTGFEEYRNGSIKINDIDSLRCNEGNILSFGKFMILAILFSYF